MRFGKLWLYFASIVFSIMMATALIVTCVAIMLYRTGRLHTADGHMLTPVVFLLFISVAIGTVISLFVAKKILKPITRLSKATGEVAKGNFAIRLDDNERVDEIRELTRNFNTMVQELSGIETLRNDFVVNVSHEFKTPIAAIEGYAALLRDNRLSEAEREEYTSMIMDSARQLTTLTGNILSLSKLDSQEVVLERELFRMDEEIRQAVLMSEPEWSAKDLDMQIDLEKITYYGSAKLLRQVWMNLMGNAVKFTPPGGGVSIRLYREDGRVTARITDTGCGMDAEVRRRAFDKFYQGDTARKSEGNGLGLALVKRIVELCGGSVTAESEPGQGSVFVVTLPADDC